MDDSKAELFDSFDELETLSFACKYWVPGSKRMAVQTMYRWANKGLLIPDGSRKKLPVIYVGKVLFTSKRAVESFIRAINEVRRTEPDDEQEKRSSATQKRLEEAGLV